MNCKCDLMDHLSYFVGIPVDKLPEPSECHPADGFLLWEFDGESLAVDSDGVHLLTATLSADCAAHRALVAGYLTRLAEWRAMTAPTEATDAPL